MLKMRIVIALAAVAMIAIFAAAAFAEAPADATYKGSKTCKMCHGGMHSAIVQGYEKTAHAKAFAVAADTPAAIVAEFADGAPVAKDQITYVLGVGRSKQAYMDANMQVLPGQWNVKEKKWETIPAVDGSKQCVGCHVTGYDTATKAWAQPGVGCESCHGPGSTHAASGDKTKITIPASLPKDRQAMICGQCHSKGTDLTKALAFPTKFRPGDDLSKVFIDAKPTTRGQNQQYSEMQGSKHLAAGVVCMTCHEPHGAGATAPFQLRKATNELCTGCHKDKDMKAHAPNAPEGATCATCHMPGGAHTFKKP